MNNKGQALDQPTNPVRPPGKNHLFAIAIDHYQHSPPLFNCVRDVERMTTLLQQHYQFEPEFTTSLYNEAATEKNIFDTFKKLIRTINPEDNLLILYSGHGEYEADVEEGYWIPVDAQLGDFSDYVSNGRVIKYLKAIKAHHILLIVDSCFSGTLFAQRNAGSAAAGLRLEDIPSRWLLTAGRNEVVSDGKPGDHSPFADNIIYFLENNPTGSLSVAELSKAVVNGVISNSQQTPRGEPLQNVGHRGGQFFFHRKGYKAAPRRSNLDRQSEIQSIATEGSSETEPMAPNSSSYRLTGILAVAVLVIAIGGMLFWMRPNGSAATPASGSTAAVNAAEATEDDQPLIGQEVEPVSPPVEEVPKRALNKVEQAWTAAQNTGSETAYRRFIERFPKSRWVAAAEQKIADQYRYSLLFSPVLKGGENLEIHFSNGKPPYQISITLPNDQTVTNNWDSNRPFSLKLGEMNKKESGLNILKIIVTDYNYKQAGQKMPVY